MTVNAFMELRFTQNKADYYDFYKSHFWARIKSRLVYLIVLSLLFGYCLGYQLNSSTWLYFVYAGLPIILLILIYYLLPVWLAMRKLNSALRQNPDYFETKTMFISPSGIKFLSGNNEVSMDWNAMSRIELTPKFILLYHTNLKVFLIPKRAFDSEPEFVQCGLEVKNYIKVSSEVTLVK